MKEGNSRFAGDTWLAMHGPYGHTATIPAPCKGCGAWVATGSSFGSTSCLSYFLSAERKFIIAAIAYYSSLKETHYLAGKKKKKSTKKPIRFSPFLPLKHRLCFKM